MALNLSALAILEKNKLASDGAWLVLLEIRISASLIIRVVRNTEDIVWNGYTWVAFPFELGDVNEDSKGELPSVTLKVSNITRAVQGYIEQADGGIDMPVVLRVVHSRHLYATEPELEEIFSVQKVTSDNQWVTFTLGGDIPTLLRYPTRRILKNFCPYPYKGSECGYAGVMPACDHTLRSCREHGNSVRFGGEPSIPQGGLYV